MLTITKNKGHNDTSPTRFTDINSQDIKHKIKTKLNCKINCIPYFLLKTVRRIEQELIR